MDLGDWAELLTLFIIPIIYALIYVNRQKLWHWYQNYIKDPKKIEGVRQTTKLFQIRLNKIQYTIILPILIIILDVFIRVKKFEAPNTPIWQQIIAITLNPFTEELLFRAAIFGVITFSILHFLKIKPGLVQTEIILIALLVQAIAFGFAHQGNIAPRILLGIIYGMLYFFTDLKDIIKKRSLNLDKTNLLPPIIAHMTTNLIVSLFS